ncbi:MAG: sigma-70 family RNA polymerase sigma factor [Polyangiaceae bacterium]|nr:sigma-70 family RNA polymerase sigma factor [Polyangiaceae bacterium]MCL4752283.1 sigma-70 family RNA polymerase sigma factor [Myxococcales bacterium]
MGGEEPSELEREIRRRFDIGDLAGATTVALRGYGPELFGFLMAFHRDETMASEVFSEASERIWKGLPGFSWQSSFRTWAYAVTRRAALTHQRDARRRGRRQQALPEGSALSVVADQVRSATLEHLKTETKTRAAALRESLPREDQELLILRIDKGLAWNELAQVLHDGDDPLDAETLKREAARLRKRFQLAKEKLLELARREGLVSGKEAEP